MEERFPKKKNVIHKLGNECISVLKRFKIGAVIKHIPGHGYTRIDSHKSLPKIRKSFNYLKNKDFQCFKGKKAFFAMTAHILYSNIDDKNPASQSKIIIQDIIRRKIRFKGLIISSISQRWVEPEIILPFFNIFCLILVAINLGLCLINIFGKCINLIFLSPSFNKISVSFP